MPHKRNPITTERITGLARVLRGNAQAAVENVALWHERDISHSGVERVILPDSTILLDYLQHLAMRVVSGLVVHEDRMRANLELTHGALFSQRVLLALVASGMTRDDAYRIVQELAQRAWDTGTPLRELLARPRPRPRPRHASSTSSTTRARRRDRRAPRRDRLRIVRIATPAAFLFLCRSQRNVPADEFTAAPATAAEDDRALGGAGGRCAAASSRSSSPTAAITRTRP